MIQVFIALLLFTFFALAGLVVDLGFVRVAERQMSASTASAALEGMRLQDAMDDVDRRAAARDMLRAHFDDDFHATAGDALNYGAGPRVTFSGGTGSMAANQKVEVHPDVVYKPDPQLNLGNATIGDMVTGSYDENDLAHLETVAYTRTDFAPSAAPAPNDQQAFLVRLRRTPDAAGLDNVAGVSSHGPALPYLFSRGSLLAAGLRARGIVVRATSVAAGRHATAVGRPRPDLEPQLMGYGPVALEYELWQALGSTFTLDFGSQGGSRGRGGGRDGTGQPRPNPFPFGPPIVPPGQEIGNIDVPNWGFLQDPEDLGSLSIGQLTPVIRAIDNRSDLAALLSAYGIDLPADADGATVDVNETFFVPIYWGDLRPVWDGVPGNKWDTVGGSDGVNPRLIGFAAIEILSLRQIGDGADASVPNIRIDARKLSTIVWPLNLSAVQTPGMAGLDPSQARGIAQLNEALDEPARAAAIVR